MLVAIYLFFYLVKASPPCAFASELPLDQWGMALPGVASEYLTDVVYADGKYVAAGERGVILVSENGMEWRRVCSPYEGMILALRHLNDQFLAITAGGLLMSDDAEEWRIGAQNQLICDLTYGVGRYIGITPSGRIFLSEDASDWRKTAEVIVLGADRRDLRRAVLVSVTYGDGLFVVVSQGGLILTSPDGETWTERRDETFESVDRLGKVVHFQGRFLVTGNPSLVSDDGVTWTTSDVPELSSVRNSN